MTPKQIIEWAIKAGMIRPSHPFNPWSASQEDLKRFAKLVAEHEREACAKVCEEWVQVYGHEDIAAAIRKALVDTVDTPEERVDETVKCGHEPVAWRNKETGTYCTGGFLSSELDQWQPLYTAPVEPVKQDPVAWVSEGVCDGQFINGKKRRIWWECIEGSGTPFYTAPQPRLDVDLTDDEIYELWVSPIYCDDYVKFARAVLAKYKEKNSA